MEPFFKKEDRKKMKANVQEITDQVKALEPMIQDVFSEIGKVSWASGR